MTLIAAGAMADKSIFTLVGPKSYGETPTFGFESPVRCKGPGDTKLPN